MQETQVQSLGWEDPLEKGMAIHSSILAWRIPWTGELDRLQSMGLWRVGHEWGINTFTFYIQLTFKSRADHILALNNSLWNGRVVYLIYSYNRFFDCLYIFTFYLFIFVCAGASLLLGLFCSWGEWGLLSSCVQASQCGGSFCCRARALELRSIVMALGLSGSVACGIFLDQGPKPCLLHWQMDSSTLSHQESPLIAYILLDFQQTGLVKL